jgi:hypothetical protein
MMLQFAEDLRKRTNQAPDFRIACHRSVSDETKESHWERRDLVMCNNCCQQPDRLKGKPEECTPEQIRECHGDETEHPCVPKKDDK